MREVLIADAAAVTCDSIVTGRILLRGPVWRWDAGSTVTMTPRYWNMWWTLTMAAAGLTLLVVLEALGILQDVGLARGVAGVLLTIVFGLTASTRSSLTGSVVTSCPGWTASSRFSKNGSRQRRRSVEPRRQRQRPLNRGVLPSR